MQAAASRAVEALLEPLGELLHELVLVGGAAIPLWIDTPGAPPPRPTNDTDVIAAIQGRVAYYAFAERLRTQQFSEVQNSDVICRWRHTPTGWLYDVMPIDADVLGFENMWYADAHSDAVLLTLPGGTRVRVASPPLLLATKFVAFNHRGHSDYLASHDMYDIMALIDGRREIVAEIAAATSSVRASLAASFEGLVRTGALRDAALNYLPGDRHSPEAEEMLALRAREIAELA